MNILLLNLNAFSASGGIEKVSRVLVKAVHENCSKKGTGFLNMSLYDKETDNRYCPSENYRAYAGRRIKFIKDAVKAGLRAEKLVLTHINLALPALLIKAVNPRIKIYLFAHGIEIWRPLSAWKKMLLKKASGIFAVSGYTKERITDLYPGIKEKTTVLNNCLDPHFETPQTFEKPAELIERYHIRPDEKVILTLCRLSSSEKYKGYDQVIKALSRIGKGNWKYLIMGKYDAVEQERVQQLVKQYGLEENIILTGFIPDEEITRHFLLGDLFIMPSREEGFGLVFIEAAACGLPLIAGNKDGSTDALLQGRLGTLVNPADEKEIAAAIQSALEKAISPESREGIQKKCLDAFGYKRYRERLEELV